ALILRLLHRGAARACARRMPGGGEGRGWPMRGDTMTDAHSTAGGGDQAPMGLLTVQVVRREMAARDVVALWLAQPGTQRAPAPYRPGQFITLALPSASDTLYRSYS